MSVFMFFFFKQKTAYEMRISDWSSDVCSSDLIATGLFIGLEHRAWDLKGRLRHSKHLTDLRQKAGGEAARNRFGIVRKLIINRLRAILGSVTSSPRKVRKVDDPCHPLHLLRPMVPEGSGRGPRHASLKQGGPGGPRET